MTRHPSCHRTARHVWQDRRLRQALLLAVLLTGCTLVRDDHRNRPLRRMRVATQPYLGAAPLLIAAAEGLFAKHGLDVEFVPLNSPAEGVPLLLSGAIDVLPGGIVPGAFNAMARGDPIRIVADKGYLAVNGCTHLAVLIRPSLTVDSAPRSVRRIAMERTAPVQYVVGRALRQVGLSLDSMDALNIPNLTRMDALAKGSIDAASSGEPWLSRIVQAHKGIVWLRAEQAVPDFQWSFILYGPNLLQHDREAGRRFMAAYREGVARYRAGKTPRNVAILAKAIGEDPALMRESCWPTVRADGRINIASLLAFQQWAHTRGLVETVATPAQLWDSSFVAWADSALRHHPE